MGNQYARVLFMFIMIILAFTQLSTCRDIPRSTTERPETEIKHLTFPSRLPAEAPVAAIDSQGTKNIYGMSKRTVPGGPNPLHN